jgi:hypothetical protein
MWLSFTNIQKIDHFVGAVGTLFGIILTLHNANKSNQKESSPKEKG